MADAPTDTDEVSAAAPDDAPADAPVSTPARPAARPWVLDLATLVGMLTGSFLLQFSFAELDGVDGFFHIRAADRLLDGLRGEMPWMPLSVFGDGWIDHQLLFHAVLAPFAWLLPDAVAAKAGAATLAGLAGFSIYLFLRRLQVPWALAWATLPFALSWTFWARMEMPRTQSMSLILLMWSLAALLRGRHGQVLAASWLYAWTYHVSVIALPIAALHALVAAFLPGSPVPRRELWKGPAAAAAGLAAGFVIHPHTPRTLWFVYQHAVVKVANRDALQVGPEWLASGHEWLLTTAGWGVVALLAAVVLVFGARRWQVAPVFVGAVALCATAGALFANKFVEYSVPLSFAALGVALGARRGPVGPLLPGWRRPVFRALAAVVVLALLVASGTRVRRAIKDHFHSPDRAHGAMTWVSENVPAGERIYHFDWTHFPELVFHGPDHGYIVGLDPHFLAWKDPELWELYQRIAEGWGSNPSKPIRERFGCEYAVLLLPYPGAEALLAQDPGLEMVFADEGGIVYRVR